jgi:hypothetical protein
MKRRREQKPASWGIETLPPESFRASYWFGGSLSLSPIGRKGFGVKSPDFFPGSKKKTRAAHPFDINRTNPIVIKKENVLQTTYENGLC